MTGLLLTGLVMVVARWTRTQLARHRARWGFPAGDPAALDMIYPSLGGLAAWPQTGNSAGWAHGDRP